MSPRPSSRERILNSAEDVIAETGAIHLTLDAVAERAEVSKGGLLYHFPTKDALLEALLERQLARFQDRADKAMARTPEGPGQRLRAHVLSWAAHDERMDRLSMAILAASIYNPTLLEPARARYREAFDDFIAGGVSPERAALITCAINGFWFTRLLGVSPFGDELKQALVAELVRLIDQ